MKRLTSLFVRFGALGAVSFSILMAQVSVPGDCASPPMGLVGWWRAEGNPLDYAGKNHGMLYNGAAFTAGKVGSTFEFDGLDDHVRIPDQPNLRLTNALTIEGWVKPAAVRHCNFLAKWNAMFGPPLRSYALGMMADGRAYFNVSPKGTDAGAEAAFSTNPVPANAWTYLAGTYDGTVLRFYMNGVLQSKVPYTAGIYPGTADLGIACAVGGLEPGDAYSPFASLFAGSIDELSVYSRALAGSEIEAIYSAGSTGKCVSPAPPAIAQQPAGQSVLVGGTARFNVGATGTPPLAYQWWFGNTAIAGATDATLVLDNVQLAQAGQYCVLVSNAVGAITSAPALLDVRAVFVRENGQVLPDTNYTRTGSATVELWTGFTSGSVFYTLDGSPPSFVSAFYHGPITLQRSATLRAIAYRADFIESGQSVPIHFTIIPAYPVATHTRGGGSVSLNPPTGPYTSSTAVTVTATPAVGWTFLEWLGDASGTSPVLHLTMNGPKRVEAVFGTMFGKTVAGNGTVLVDPVSPYYPYGTAVRLTAVPQAGNTFRVWGKAAGGTVNPLLFTVTNANSVISALFVPLDAGQYDLSVIPNGNGKVTINPRANTYAALVTLIATPDAGQTFLGWSGDASGTENPLALSMTATKLIIANFTRNPVLSVDSAPEWLPVAGCRLTLASEFGVAYQIQVSANLTEWTPLITLTNVYGRTQFTDEATAQLPHRFYRAVAE